MMHGIECDRPCAYEGYAVCKSPGWRCNVIAIGCVDEQKIHRCPTCEERHAKLLALPPIRLTCVCGDFVETKEPLYEPITEFIAAHCDHVSPNESGWHRFPLSREGKQICFLVSKGLGVEASDGLPNPSADRLRDMAESERD